ncbi:hypothetical protein SAMN05518845_10116 [Variovorax sp. YR750]|uniref:hypothetical protein n=1 Tax=Variovorax sp. YR750 TaxID=1884384 RepID=UPI0008BD7062|nr:hypothetical protein [Variovorax sp. YR750]SEK34438.1 hypothetical protein SAMN05518845_10116 [Variovorax sp. YR750]
MNTALHLDITNGRLSAAGIVAGIDTRAASLPDSFVQTTQAVNVEGRLVDCVFARTTTTSGDMTAQLELRFEEFLLVSCFLTLTTPALCKLEDADFYGSVDQRYRFHERWLASMGVSGTSTAFPWGSAGVARDRSDNVYIYIHNRNNRWALR